MGAASMFALFLLPAVVSAWPAPPPGFSLPPISVNLPSINLSLPPEVAAYFGFPTGSTEHSSGSTSSTTTPTTTGAPAAESFNTNAITNSAGNTNSGNTITGAGTLSVQHAAGSPSVSYNGDSTVIQADLELSEGASATCTLSRGDSEIVSKDCSSGTFTHIVRQEGTYKLAVEATDSNSNRIIHTKSLTVQFD